MIAVHTNKGGGQMVSCHHNIQVNKLWGNNVVYTAICSMCNTFIYLTEEQIENMSHEDLMKKMDEYMINPAIFYED